MATTPEKIAPVIVCVSLAEEDVRFLDLRGIEEGRTRSAVVRRMIAVERRKETKKTARSKK